MLLVLCNPFQVGLAVDAVLIILTRESKLTLEWQTNTKNKFALRVFGYLWSSVLILESDNLSIMLEKKEKLFKQSIINQQWHFGTRSM